MTRTTWFGLLSTLILIVSMGVSSFATTVQAAGARHATHAAKPKKASTAVRCKTRTKATGTIRYSDWQFPDTLNPYQTTAAVSFETINALQDGLFVYNQHAHLIPQMATKVPTVKNGLIKNGGKTIIIQLKKGMHWSNGAEITSKDLWFGWKVGMDKATGPACSGSCDQIRSISTPSRYTAVLQMRTVYAPAIPYAMPGLWPNKWSGAWGTNDYRTAAQKLGQDTSFNFESDKFPTSGAYQVASFVKDDRIVLKPMKYYSTMNCGGAVKQLIFAGYTSKEGMIAAAANRQTDITQNYTPADLPELRKHTAYTLHSDPGFIFEHLEFNVDKTYNGKANPLANQKVRLALSLALDKIGMIRSALGISSKQAAQIAAWTPWINTSGLVQPFADRSVRGQWDPIQKKYVQTGTPRAVKDARKLLSQTPYKGGFTIDFYTTAGNPVRTAQAGVIQNNWHNIGVNVNLNQVKNMFSDYAHGGVTARGTFQVAMFAFQGSPDPDQFKYNLQSKYVDREQTTHASINENYSGIHNKVIDNALTKGSHTFNKSTRARYYAQVQVELNKQAYWVPLYFRPQIATSDSSVAGFINNPTQAGPTWNVYSYRAKTK